MGARFLKGIFPGVEVLVKHHVHLKLCVPVHSPTKCMGAPITPILSTVGIGSFTSLINMKWFLIVLLSLYYIGSFSSSTLISFTNVTKENLLEMQKSCLTFIQETYPPFAPESSFSRFQQTLLIWLRIQRGIRHTPCYPGTHGLEKTDMQNQEGLINTLIINYEEKRKLQKRKRLILSEA